MNRSTQSGLTLIELMVVIVILGILAAIALPRLVSMEGEARLAVADGLFNTLRSGSKMVYAKVDSAGQATDSHYSVDIDGGVTVDARYGYPDTNSNANIENLVGGFSGRVRVSGTAVRRNVWVDGRADCGVTYQRAENAGDRPTIMRVVSGCD